MRFGRVVERHDVGMPVEDGLNDAALHALSAAVDQADFEQAGLARGADVFVNDGWDVARVKGMEVEGILDRNAVNHGGKPNDNW
jgi:hypothetical protein